MRRAFAFFVILDWRCFGISKVQHQLNEEINDKEIRLIGEGGEQMGIVSGEEALRIAEESGDSESGTPVVTVS